MSLSAFEVVFKLVPVLGTVDDVVGGGGRVVIKSFIIVSRSRDVFVVLFVEFSRRNEP